MYLLELNKETGLISEDVTESGWRGIKEFRDLVEKHGFQALTLVALSKDYQSPFRFYSNKERPFVAMEEIYGDKEKHDITTDLFVHAMDKYEALQFNSELEQERLNEEINHRLLNQMREANHEEDDIKMEKTRKSMQAHQKFIDSFKSGFSREEAVSKAVTKNGYELTRIEADLAFRKNSKFKNISAPLKNPNKLGISK